MVSKPYLSKELEGKKIKAGDAWEYRLPDAKHDDNLKVKFEVKKDLDFLRFDGD